MPPIMHHGPDARNLSPAVTEPSMGGRSGFLKLYDVWDGPSVRRIHVTTKREAWALDELIQAGEIGCTPIDNPAPRWSGYVHKLKKNHSLSIQTITEPHGGPFKGTHGRYVLRSIVKAVGGTTCKEPPPRRFSFRKGGGWAGWGRCRTNGEPGLGRLARGLTCHRLTPRMSLWGPVGLVLAVPLTLAIVVMGQHLPRLDFLRVLLGNEPVLEPHEHLYHQFLEEEASLAAKEAEHWIGEHTFENYLDEVAIPALCVAADDQKRGVLSREQIPLLSG